MALGMTLNGAHGRTYSDRQAAVRLEGMAEAAINQGYRDLLGLLGGLDSRTELRIANSIWGHSKLPIAPAFTEAGRAFFDAEVGTLDFGSPEALTAINGWVNGKTKGRIPRLLDQISADEVLFLINAIYFKGRWRNAFDPKDTRDGRFHGDGRNRAARLMFRRGGLRYQGADDHQAVDLLYGHGAFAMTVLLPRPGRTPAELLAGLDPASWGRWRSDSPRRKSRSPSLASVWSTDASSRTISSRWEWGSPSRARRLSPGSPTCGRTGCTSREWIRRRSSK